MRHQDGDEHQDRRLGDAAEVPDEDAERRVDRPGRERGVDRLHERARDREAHGDADDPPPQAEDERAEVDGEREERKAEQPARAVAGLEDARVQSLQGLEESDPGQDPHDRDRAAPAVAQHDVDEVGSGDHEAGECRHGGGGEEAVDAQPDRENALGVFLHA